MHKDSHTQWAYLVENREGKQWFLQTAASRQTPGRCVLHDSAEIAKAKMNQINGLGDPEMEGARISVVPVEITVQQTGASAFTLDLAAVQRANEEMQRLAKQHGIAANKSAMDAIVEKALATVPIKTS